MSIFKKIIKIAADLNSITRISVYFKTDFKLLLKI